MNEKKAKELRRIIKFHPKTERVYEKNDKGTVTADAMRHLYQVSKRKVVWNKDAKRR